MPTTYDLQNQLPGQSIYGSGDTSPVQAAAGQNQAALPDITAITNSINQLLQNAQTAANQARIPGAAGLESTSSVGIGQALHGQLPSDVINQISTEAAQRGVMSGSPAGPSTNADFLRSLGLNSLGMMGQGQNWLTQAYGRNPVARILDPTSQMITPGQLGQLGTQAQQLQLEQERLNLQRYLGQLEAQTRQAAYRSGGGGGSTGGGGASSGRPVGLNFADLFGGGGTNTLPSAGGGTSQSFTYYPDQGATVGWYGGGNLDLGDSGDSYTPAYSPEDYYYYSGVTPEDYSYYYGEG